MSTVKFSDLSFYIYYDIIKYMEIEDQLEQQTVNKTWTDATKRALRNYKILAVGSQSEWDIEGCDHLSYVEPTLQIETYPLSRFFHWNINKHLPGLTTLTIGDFEDTNCLDLNKFPKAIEHLEISSRCSISGLRFLTEIIEHKLVTSLKCLTFEKVDEEWISLLLKLVRQNTGIKNISLGMVSFQVMDTIIDLLVDVHRLDFGSDMSGKNIDKAIKKFPNLRGITNDWISLEQMSKIYTKLQKFQFSNENEECLRVAEFLLSNSTLQLKHVSISDLIQFGGFQCLRLCSSNLLSLSLYFRCKFFWLAQFDIEFRKLRFLCIHLSDVPTSNGLVELVTKILTKCSKLKTFELHLLDDGHKFNLNRLIKPMANFSAQHPKRKIEFLCNKKIDYDDTVSNLRIYLTSFDV